MSSTKGAYHHGNLRAAVIEGALEVLAEHGPTGLSLREVARRAGVSHAAPAHHFGDKTGLLTAIAADGYRLLADALKEASERTGDFLEVGVAYVRFAIEHRSHFEVMFRAELYRSDDPALMDAQRAASSRLYRPAHDALDTRAARSADAGLAAWSLVHGLATLWLNGNFGPDIDDPDELTRRTAVFLGPGDPPPAPNP